MLPFEMRGKKLIHHIHICIYFISFILSESTRKELHRNTAFTPYLVKILMILSIILAKTYRLYGRLLNTIETHAESLQKWAGFSLYFMLYFY